MHQMPYALFRNGTRISATYKTRNEVELVAFERNLVQLTDQNDGRWLNLIPGYAIRPCDPGMRIPQPWRPTE